MLQNSWSPNIVVARAKKMELFTTELIPCTSILFHWMERGIMKTKNINFIEKLSGNPRDDSSSYNKHPSIDHHPTEVDTRKNFGH